MTVYKVAAGQRLLMVESNHGGRDEAGEVF